MKDKVVIITGASQGIGKAIALELAKQPVKIAITYAGNQQKAEDVVSQITQLGRESMAVKLDLKNLDTVKSLFSTVEESLGKVDVLISNAYGRSIFKPLAMIEETEYDEAFAYTKGTFFLLQEAAQKIRDHGSILVFSSGATQMPTPAGGTYAGSKAAIERFAYSLGKELGNRKINVNVISPGVTQTESLVAPQEMVDQLVSQTPLGRLGTPQDIANAVVLLASDQGKWINMQNIGVNGGIL
ncbi:MAG TPA: 3-ketoacyl-ACP reductase [Microscillaceae bacterium]|nr:3-ketoacyl-ACP reductase [Microscillaceae bacterium]